MWFIIHYYCYCGHWCIYIYIVIVIIIIIVIVIIVIIIRIVVIMIGQSDPYSAVTNLGLIDRSVGFFTRCIHVHFIR